MKRREEELGFKVRGYFRLGNGGKYLYFFWELGFMIYFNKSDLESWLGFFDSRRRGRFIVCLWRLGFGY